MNIRMLQLVSTTRRTASLLFALLTLVIAPSAADEVSSVMPASAKNTADTTSSLPDLGSPVVATGAMQPNINAQGAGLSYRDNINGKLISINPQYSKLNGLALGASLASPISKNMAIGFLLTAGSDKSEWLLNTGFDLSSNQRFIFSFGQLRQKLDFNFISGHQKAAVRQDNVAASYQYFLGKDWLNAAEMNAYLSHTGSRTLGDKTYFTDTASLYELWSDPRRIAGGRVTGMQGRLVFTPASKTTIKVGLGAERLTYDYLSSKESSQRATGSAELTQRLADDFNFRASVNAAAAQHRYALGLGRSFKDGAQLSGDIVAIHGRDNTFDDKQLLLSYSQSFGASPAQMYSPALNNLGSADATLNQAYANTTSPSPIANIWASSLVDQVSRRPNFLPAQVIAKVDTSATPTRLIAIDKLAIPAGSSINPATGNITSPTGTAVGSIAGVTKNAVAFVNAGQFTLSGSSGLVINPNLIAQPAVGVIDTYIVTMNNSAGGGSTVATIRVSHGSTKIDSVVMSSGIMAPTLSGFSLSAASVALGATPPTIVAPTSASSGSISYSSATPGVASISSGGVITIVGAGSTILTATQAANGSYVSATTTTVLTVTAAATYITQGGLTWAPITYQANWSTASAACSSMSNTVYASGWRMPSYTELMAFYSSGSLSPAPASWLLGRTWSSTISPTNSFFYKDVNLSTGGGLSMHRLNNNHVSCVHS